MSTSTNPLEANFDQESISSQGRIHEDLFVTELSGGIWGQQSPGAALPHANYAARLLVVPFCELRTIAPESAIVRVFEQIDEQFSGEIRQIFERKPYLRHFMLLIGIEVAYTLAAAFEQDKSSERHAFQFRSDDAQGRPKFPPPKYPRPERPHPDYPEGIVDRGAKFLEQMARNTSNEQFAEALRKVITLTRPLNNTPFSEWLRVLKSPDLDNA